MNIRVGQLLPSNSGTFEVVYVSPSPLKFAHPPTGALVPIGSVLRNPAGWFGQLLWEDENFRASWSWTREMPPVTQEVLGDQLGPLPE